MAIHSLPPDPGTDERHWDRKNARFQTMPFEFQAFFGISLTMRKRLSATPSVKSSWRRMALPHAGS